MRKSMEVSTCCQTKLYYGPADERETKMPLQTPKMASSNPTVRYLFLSQSQMRVAQ